MSTLSLGDWALPMATELYVAEKPDVAEVLHRMLIPSRSWRGQSHTDQCSQRACPWCDAPHTLHLSHLLDCRALHHDWLNEGDVTRPNCRQGLCSRWYEAGALRLSSQARTECLSSLPQASHLPVTVSDRTQIPVQEPCSTCLEYAHSGCPGGR